MLENSDNVFHFSVKYAIERVYPKLLACGSKFRSEFDLLIFELKLKDSEYPVVAKQMKP